MKCALDQQLLERIEKDVREHLSHKSKRLAHTLSVAECAVSLARVYDVDESLARAAGLLHDWDKADSVEKVVSRSRALGIDLGVDLDLVQPLLHGILAARELPARYPELPEEVFRAIAVHTTASEQMSPLDMVVFVADGIEPLRPGTPGIEAVRALVGKASLEDLFWKSFTGGIEYVIEGGRYLYPGTIDVYNSIAARRARR